MCKRFSDDDEAIAAVLAFFDAHAAPPGEP